MTAEIVLMNTEAVAMAADSAVSTPNKIFNSANKIFMASPSHAVGIMIYHNARFMGVPWEVVIKLYRDHMAQKESQLPTLGDYVEDFTGFLKANVDRLCPTGQQVAFFEEEMILAFHDISDMIDYEVQVAASMKSLSEEEIAEVTRSVVTAIYTRLSLEPDFFPEPPENLIDYIKEAYQDTIDTHIDVVFESRPMSDETKQQLRDIAVMINTKFFESAPFTGIVFAGFGADDLYPVCQSFVVGGVVNSTLKYMPSGLTKASYFGSAGSVIPFAQKDMVISYMTGVHPDNADFLLDVLPDYLMFQLVNMVENEGDFGKQTKKKVQDLLLSRGPEYVHGALIDLLREGGTLHSRDILQIVSILPKDELAALAESLVTLTSLKRRFSFARETVGGPVDIALISKKDGFIWVKRKHYFDSSLNVHYDPS